jgi:hypothetical protein
MNGHTICQHAKFFVYWYPVVDAGWLDTVGGLFADDYAARTAGTSADEETLISAAWRWGPSLSIEPGTITKSNGVVKENMRSPAKGQLSH